METPPRAWGRQNGVQPYPADLRNTPTGVGKTKASLSPKNGVEKHPHGRGEDLGTVKAYNNPRETPPRAWGRPVATYTALVQQGNTPTGVGKTQR